MKNLSLLITGLIALSIWGIPDRDLQPRDTTRPVQQNARSGLFISKVIKSDEYVLFYPTLAALDPGKQFWQVEVHGLIFEHTTFSKSIPFGAILPDYKKLKPAKKNRSLYRQRAGWFFVDNEGRKKLKIQLQGKQYTLKPSRSNGHFKGSFRIAASEVRHWPLDRFNRIKFRAVTRADDKRIFSGEIFFIPSKGVSVISDIDDTIKLSEVYSKKKLIRNTFFKPYQAIPGMAESYQRWYKRHHTVFHYVTSSPWQLYVPLRKFMQHKGFPPGSFSMKYFRVVDRSFFNIFSKSPDYKVNSITTIIRRYPQRSFILIGDSGEKDLQVYTAIAQRFPGRINVIYIRDTGQYNTKKKQYARFKQALKAAARKIPHVPVIVFSTRHKAASLKFYGPRLSHYKQSRRSLPASRTGVTH